MEFHSKNGQAMIEFMVGLVGILVLVLALSHVATLVNDDFESILNARMDVAEDLLASSYSTPEQSYDPRGSYDELNRNVNINSSGDYERFQADYPQRVRDDGFEYLRNGQDPLSVMSGSSKSSSVQIDSALMQDVFGRSSLRLSHEAWMPPWDDLQ
jgi:hypothetical protein